MTVFKGDVFMPVSDPTAAYLPMWKSLRIGDISIGVS